MRPPGPDSAARTPTRGAGWREADKDVGQEPGRDDEGRSPAPKQGSVVRRAGGTGCWAAAGRGSGLCPGVRGLPGSEARTIRPPGRDGAAVLPALAPLPAPAWMPQPLGVSLTSTRPRRPSLRPCYQQRPAPPALVPGTARPGDQARLRRPHAPRPHPPAPASWQPCRVPRGGAPVDRPGQSQASAAAEEPMNDELLRAGGCGPERSPRLRPLLLSLPALAFPLKPVALQRLRPLSVLSLSN